MSTKGRVFFAPFRVDKSRATARNGPARRPAANRLGKSHNLPDAKIRAMVKNHFRFFEYLKDKGAGELALAILRDGIFKPTPRSEKPLLPALVTPLPPWNNSVKRNLDPRRERLKCPLRPRRVPPHVARAPARLDLRVLDLAVYFFRL